MINLNLVSTQSRNEGDSPGKITLVKFEDDSDSGNFDVSDEKIPESVKRWREANSGVVTKANTTEINDS